MSRAAASVAATPSACNLAPNAACIAASMLAVCASSIRNVLMDTPSSNVSTRTSSVAKPPTGTGNDTSPHSENAFSNFCKLEASVVRSTCWSMCTPNCCTVCSS